MASSPPIRPPLTGLRVIELAGLAPAPFASLLLGDYGASILRIDRPHQPTHTPTSPPPTSDLLTRNKRSVAVDLKDPSGLALLWSLLSKVDVLIDPYRPGVLESLSLAPETLLATNPRLIIARLTGFRRDGPYAQMAGHDINYLAVSGILSQLGRASDVPYAPGNILADFAGGGLMCVLGILMALIGRTQTGRGQVVEANMVDGSAYLGTFMRYMRKTPLWDQPRGQNVLDGGCPWYDVYQCKDGGYMAVGTLEPQFFKELLEGLEIDQDWLKRQYDRAEWPVFKDLLRNCFLKKTREQWEEVFAGKDACCTPVLEQAELEAMWYEQRPAVRLATSPRLETHPKGDGMAWSGMKLAPGEGGEEVLKSWMGWKRGREYDVHNGGLVKANGVKL